MTKKWKSSGESHSCFKIHINVEVEKLFQYQHLEHHHIVKRMTTGVTLSFFKPSFRMGRKLSKSIIFNRSKESPNLLNLSSWVSSANRLICFIVLAPFLLFDLIISHFPAFFNIFGVPLSKKCEPKKQTERSSVCFYGKYKCLINNFLPWSGSSSWDARIRDKAREPSCLP